jgi:hypothetical protein
MKAKLAAVAIGAPFLVTAIIAIGALFLMADEASAARHSQHGQVRYQAPQSSSPGDLYGSFSQGHQSYPNPDRELYVNRSCC